MAAGREAGFWTFSSSKGRPVKTWPLTSWQTKGQAPDTLSSFRFTGEITVNNLLDSNSFCYHKWSFLCPQRLELALHLFDQDPGLLIHIKGTVSIFAGWPHKKAAFVRVILVKLDHFIALHRLQSFLQAGPPEAGQGRQRLDIHLLLMDAAITECDTDEVAILGHVGVPLPLDLADADPEAIENQILLHGHITTLQHFGYCSHLPGLPLHRPRIGQPVFIISAARRSAYSR